MRRKTQNANAAIKKKERVREREKAKKRLKHLDLKRKATFAGIEKRSLC